MFRSNIRNKVYLTGRQEYYDFDGNDWNTESNLVSN